MHPLAPQLGASLYVPATRDDLVDIGSGVKIPEARSIIYCTEDAVREEHVPLALANLAFTLPRLTHGPLRFVRARNPEVLARVLDLPGTDALTGFVLPKVTPANVGAYLDVLGEHHPHPLMITLETRETFSARAMERLRDELLERHANVLSIRIGGNDLLGLLGMRRQRGVSAYDTPLGPVIDQLVGLFKPWGFNVSAPVYDFTDDPLTLAREVQLDLLHGLFGKTAIHPRQIPVIEAAYRVTPEDVDMAQAILRPDAPAVFRVGDAMCEPSTHRNWALGILERARVYGTVEALGMPFDVWTGNAMD